MYFKQDDIDSLLECPICNQKFDDPRLIPCGECICNRCLEDKLVRDLSGFNCEFCNEFHKVPVTGFTPVKFLQKLKEKKSYEVYRSETVENFKNNLKQIQRNIEELEISFNTNEDKVTDYCDFLRYDIELATESLMQELTKYRDCFMQTVDNYEKECLKNIEEGEEFKKKFLDTLNEVKKFYSSWNSQLKEHFIDEDEVIRSLTKSVEYLRILNSKKNSLKYFQFNGKILNFKGNTENLTSNLLGSISYNNLVKE